VGADRPDDDLVERLAGADAEHTPAGVERAERPEGLRDDRRGCSGTSASSPDVPSCTRDVRSPTGASQESENGACPPWCRHGWKWSLIITESRPTSSASTA
jgi:hypothetical protein